MNWKCKRPIQGQRCLGISAAHHLGSKIFLRHLLSHQWFRMTSFLLQNYDAESCKFCILKCLTSLLSFKKLKGGLWHCQSVCVSHLWLLNQLVDFHEIPQGGYAIGGDLDAIIFNFIALIVLKWRRFKLLRWVKNLHQSPLDYQSLTLEAMVTRPSLCDSWSPTCVTKNPIVGPIIYRNSELRMFISLCRGVGIHLCQQFKPLHSNLLCIKTILWNKTYYIEHSCIANCKLKLKIKAFVC
jgi:hypothetical protein